MDKDIYWIKINNKNAKNLQKMFNIASFALNSFLYLFSKVAGNARTLLHRNFTPSASQIRLHLVLCSVLCS